MTAVDDVAETDENAPIDIPVLTNDRNPAGESVSIIAWSPGQHGSVSLNDDNTLRYMPNPGYRGIDRFSYTITGADGTPSTASVTVYIGYVNLRAILVMPDYRGDVTELPVQVQVGNRLSVLYPTRQGNQTVLTIRVPAYGVQVVRVKPQYHLQQTVSFQMNDEDLQFRFSGPSGGGMVSGDASGDNRIDDQDLLMVLFAFGEQGQNIPADVDGSGSVDDADLLIILFNFGLLGDP